MTIRLRHYRPGDWPDVQRIHEEGIATGQATFDTRPKARSEWEAAPCRLMAEINGAVAGWAVVMPASTRECYRGVGEETIYVGEGFRGLGLGRQLLERLIGESEKAGFWTLQAILFPDNQASIRLHEACGFRLVGRREKIARLDGEWRDTLLYERRSPVI